VVKRFSQRLNDRDRPHAYRRYPHQQVNALFFVIRETVGVELLADGRVCGFLFFVLVENPFANAAA